MKIYKFKNKIDGNFAFILAENLDEAIKFLSTKTIIEFDLVDLKEPEELQKPICILNNILPF